MTVSINPRLDQWELFSFASDTENWSILDAIAKHPSAWPQLASWVVSVKQHPESAGPPPEPTEPRKRHLLPRRAHVPLIEMPDSDKSSGDPGSQNSGASNPIVEYADSDVLQSTLPSQPGPVGLETSLRILHGDTGSTGIMKESTDTSSDRYTTSSSHRIPSRLVVLVLFVTLLGIAAAYAGVVAWHAHEHGLAWYGCTNSSEKLNTSKQSWQQTMSSGNKLAETAVNKVADASTISKLQELLEQEPEEVTETCSSNMTTNDLQALSRLMDETTASYEATTDRIKTSRKIVEVSMETKICNDDRTSLQKTLASARTLLKDSVGKVSDPATRTQLQTIIDNGETVLRNKKSQAKDFSAIQTETNQAMKNVKTSMKTRAKADADAAEREQERSQADSRQQPSQRQENTYHPFPTMPTPRATTPSSPTTQEPTPPQPSDPGNNGSLL